MSVNVADMENIFLVKAYMIAPPHMKYFFYVRKMWVRGTPPPDTPVKFWR